MANDVVINVKADTDHAERGLSGLASKAGASFNILKVGALAGGAALAGLGVAALKIGGDFDSAYDKIRIGTGATGKALDGLQGDFKAVFGAVPTDMASASTAIADLNTRLGLTGAPLQTLSKQILEMSRITGTDLGSNITTVTRAFGDWSISTEDMSGAMDSLFKVSQATGPSVDEIGRLVVQYGAPLRQFGFSFEEAATLMGQFQKQGVNTELVMGSLRIAIGKFAKENIPLREGLEGTIRQIQELGPSAEATALAMEIFGARAGADMADTILAGKFAIEDWVAAVKDSDETILGAAAQTADFGEKFTVLKNQIILAVEPLATRLVGALTAFADLLLTRGFPVIQDFGRYLSVVVKEGDTMNDWLSHLPGFLQPVAEALGNVINFIRDEGIPAFQDLGAFLQDKVWPALLDGVTTIRDLMAALRPFVEESLKGFWQVLQDLWPPTERLFEYLATHKETFLALAAAAGIWFVAINPIAQVILGIGAAVLAIGFVRAHWDDITAAVQRFIDKVMEIPILGTIITTAVDIAKGQLAILLDKYKMTADQFGLLIKFVSDLVHGDWRAAWGAFFAIVANAVNLTIIPLREFGNVLGKLPGPIGDLGNKLAGLKITTGQTGAGLDLLAGAGRAVARTFTGVSQTLDILDPEMQMSAALMSSHAGATEDVAEAAKYASVTIPPLAGAIGGLGDAAKSAKEELEDMLAPLEVAVITGAATDNLLQLGAQMIAILKDGADAAAPALASALYEMLSTIAAGENIPAEALAAMGQEIGALIQQGLAGSSPGMVAAARSLSEALGVPLKTAAEESKKAAEKAAAETKTHLKEIEDAAKRHAEAVKSALSGMVSSIQGELSGLKSAISNFLREPLAEELPFTRALENLNRQIKILELQKIKLEIAGAPEEQIKAISDAIGTLNLQVQKTNLERDLAIDPLKKSLNDLVAVAPRPFAVIRDEILKTIGQVKNLEAVLPSIVAALENMQDPAAREAKKLAESLINAFKEGGLNKGAAQQTIFDWLGSVMDSLTASGASAETIETFSELANSTMQAFRDGMDLSLVMGKMAELLTLVATNPDIDIKAKETAQKLLESMGAAIGVDLGDAVNKGTGDLLKSIPDTQMIEAGKSGAALSFIWGKFYAEGLKQIWGSFVQPTLDYVLRASNDLLKPWAQFLGRDIGWTWSMSVAQGIESGKDSIVGAAVRVVLEAIAAARAASQTASPSKVWMGLGKQWMEGLGQGIMGGYSQHVAPLVGAATKFGAAMYQVSGASSVAPASNSSRTVNVGPISITINGPADGPTVRQAAHDGVWQALRQTGAVQ